MQKNEYIDHVNQVVNENDVRRKEASSISAEIDLSLAEIIAQTIRGRMEELVANVEANNALLRRLTGRNVDC